jgi:hypothetical protein
MNRVITRWIVAFAALSTLLMLLSVITREGGQALLSWLPRERALMACATLLILFPLYALPGVLLRSERESRTVATGLLLDTLIFSAVPLVFAAYISAVSAHGLLRLALLIAGVGALPLALVRLGFVTERLRWLMGIVATCILLLPVLTLLVVAAQAPSLSAVFEAISPLDWARRIAIAREVPALAPFIIFAGVSWGIALLPRRKSAAVALVGCSVAILLSPPQAVEWRMLGSFPVRGGVRVPVELKAPTAGDTCLLTQSGQTLTIPADGAVHHALMTVTDPAAWARVAQGASASDVPPPWVRQDSNDPVRARLSPSAVQGAWLDERALALGPAALEALDVLVLEDARFQELSVAHRGCLRTATACGLLLVLEHAAQESAEAIGTGVLLRTRGTAAGESRFHSWRKPEFSLADREFLDTVAPLGWQELDMRAVFWFTLAYHAAFLAAFLLPLLLDAHKAPRVYLASVTFVVLVVALGGYRVLKSIFLKDNQVYTQSVALMVGEARPGADVLLRRFHAYASMSAEQCGLAFPEGTEPLLVAGDALRAGVVRPDLHRAHWTLGLDRHEGKALARVDDLLPVPWLIRPDGAGFHCERVPHPSPLAEARITGAFLVDQGRVMQQFAMRGERLVPSDEVTLFPPGAEGAFRKLQGRYGLAMPRHLLVAFEGVARADVDEDWLVARDAGCYWMIPVP